MNRFRPEDRAQSLSWNTPISKVTQRCRTVRTRRRSTVEWLESRCLLSIYQPHTEPLSPEPVEGSPLAADIVLASFASDSPDVGLTATVVFDGGSPIAADVVRSPGNGVELVPGVGD